MIVRIRPPVIHVKNLQETESFFRYVFGFELVGRETSDLEMTTVIRLKDPASGVSLKLLRVDDPTAADAPPEREEDRNVSIYSDDLVADVDVLLERGADFSQLPGGTTSRTRYARLIGPEERAIELVQVADEG